MFGRAVLTQQIGSAAKFDRSKSNADLLIEVLRENDAKQKSAKFSVEDFELDNISSRNYFLKLLNLLIKYSHEVVYGRYWLVTVTMACVLSAIIAGWDTYPTSPFANTLIYYLNAIVLSIFFFEIFLKLIAVGKRPWMYFLDPVHGRWNAFDFVVTILSIPGVAGKNSSFVKIFRLFRLLEQLQQIPPMKAIVMGLIAGIKSIVYILMLLLLVFYLYAVLGVYSFQNNNPFCFSSVYQALISLFRGMTLENWEMMMFIDAYGCARFRGNLYADPGLNISYADVNTMYLCNHSEANPVIATLFWVSFVVIASFIVLSLFIGVITLHMQDSINTVRLEREEAGRKRRLAEQIEDLNNIRMNNAVLSIISRVNESRRLKEQNKLMTSARQGDDAETDALINKLTRAASDGVNDVSDNSATPHFGSNQGENSKLDMFSILRNNKVKEVETAPSKIEVATNAKMRKINEMTGLLIEVWRGKNHAQAHYEEVTETLTPIGRRLHAMKMAALGILDSTAFHVFLVLLISISSILVGMELDMATDENRHIFFSLERLMVALFCCELLVRIVADEFDLYHFFRSTWNSFDLFVIISSLLPGANIIILMLRLLRVFRLLRLLKMFPQLQTIVQALISGIASIRYVGAIIAFSFYVFALVGVFLFNENDPDHFGSLDKSLITLLSIVTLDNWGDIMFRNMYGCDIYPPPLLVTDDKSCPNPDGLGFVAALYFVVFIIINTFVLLTLFIGVVTTAMEAAASEKNEQMKVEEKLNALVAADIVSSHALELYKRVFTLLDTDGSGSIETAEIQMGLSCIKLNPSSTELQNWLTLAGLDPIKGSYSLVDFVKFMLFMKRRSTMNRFKDAVRRVCHIIKEHRPIPEVVEEDEDPSLSNSIEFKVSSKLSKLKQTTLGLSSFVNRKLFSSSKSSTVLAVDAGTDASTPMTGRKDESSPIVSGRRDESSDGAVEPLFQYRGAENQPMEPIPESSVVESFESQKETAAESTSEALPLTSEGTESLRTSSLPDNNIALALESHSDIISEFVPFPISMNPKNDVMQLKNIAAIPRSNSASMLEPSTSSSMAASNTMPLTNHNSFNDDSSVFHQKAALDFNSESKIWTKRSMKEEGTLLELPIVTKNSSSTRPVVRSIVAI